MAVAMPANQGDRQTGSRKVICRYCGFVNLATALYCGEGNAHGCGAGLPEVGRWEPPKTYSVAGTPRDCVANGSQYTLDNFGVQAAKVQKEINIQITCDTSRFVDAMRECQKELGKTILGAIGISGP